MFSHDEHGSKQNTSHMCMRKLRGWGAGMKGEERDGVKKGRKRREKKILRENEKIHYVSPRKSHRKVAHCP